MCQALQVDFNKSVKGNVKVIKGKKKDQKLTKDGNIKQTPNNSKINREYVMPFKEEDVTKMIEWLDMRVICAGNDEDKEISIRNKYLFIMGCNAGLRVSDLCSLTWNDLFDEHGTLRESKVIKPKKTSNIDKHINQEFNDAFRKAVILYIKENKISVNIDMIKIANNIDKKLTVKRKTLVTMERSFRKNSKYTEEDIAIIKGEIQSLENEWNNISEKLYVFPSREGGHIEDGIIRKFINDGAKACGINYNVSTHSMRKSFARIKYDKAENKTAALHKIMEMFGHSSERITLRYIGITQEEIKDFVNETNIGMEISEDDEDMLKNFKL